MREVFADTSYWIALLVPHDDLNAKAKAVSAGLGLVRIVTTELVLAELLNHFASRGSVLRDAAVKLCDGVRQNPNVAVVPATSLQFRAALERYRHRGDKSCGLTDCASFLVMEERGIREALTADADFRQAGFETLLA